MGIMSRFPTKYLKGDDIEPGEIVSIKEVRDEIVGVEQESLPVLYLKEYDKGIVLNKTNAKSIVGIYGDDERRWDGKKLMLVTETVRFKGESQRLEVYEHALDEVERELLIAEQRAA